MLEAYKMSEILGQDKTYKMFEMFGQERRFAIMLALVERAMSHGELSAMFNAPGIFPHLQKLEAVGLITKHTYGPRDVKYRANPDTLELMATYLSDMALTATRVPA